VFNNEITPTKGCFTVLGEPIAKGAVKVAVVRGFAHKYMPKKTRDGMNDIRGQLVKILPANWKPIDGALALDVVFFRTKPKSAGKKVLYPITRPDCENYLKLLNDCFNGILFKDDSLVVRVTMEKAFATGVAQIQVKYEVLK